MPNRRQDDLTISSLLLSLFVLTAVGFLIVFTTLMNNRQIGRENNTYLQTMVCIASVTPTERTASYVQGCYDKAEDANGNNITHFGNGIK
jgi:ABC-type lipoprotein release transport system permease subunit